MKYRGLKRAVVMLLALAMLITSSGIVTFAESLNEEATNPTKDAVTTEQAEDIQDESVPSGSQEEAAKTEEAKGEESAKDEASDKTADEKKLTAKDWEKDLPKDVSKDVREAMAQVAKSQVGDEADLYKAFANADSIKDGDASFVMFVLEYANVLGVKKAIGDDSNGTVKSGSLEIPVNANIKKWVKELKEANIYINVENGAIPEQGDIVFTHSIGNNDAAVVLSVDEGKLTVAGIETEKKEDKVSKYTVDADKLDGFVSLKDIAPEEFTEEPAEEAAEETADAEGVENTEDADKVDELTEEELAAKKAEEEAAAKAAEEAAKAEKAGLAAQSAEAKITTAPGFGSKIKSLFAQDAEAEINISGYMPEGATVKAYPVKVEIPGQNVIAAYDITIYVKDEDGNDVEWQPEVPLNVSIKDNKLAEAAENADSEAVFSVFHMKNKNAKAEKLESVDLGSGEAAFKADSFSIYVVTEEPEAVRVHYRFWLTKEQAAAASGTPYRTISLQNGEQSQAPADPTDPAQGQFEGWKDAANDEAVTFPITATVSGDADTYKDIYAEFDGAQYATFMSLPTGTSRTVYHTAAMTEDNGSYSIDLSTVPEYGAPNGYRFVGWTTQLPTDNKGYGENIAKANYKNDTTVSYDGSVTLYPVCKKVYNVSFNGNGGLVQNLPVYKVLVTNDDTWNDVLVKVTDVSREGHTKNNGWFDGPGDDANAVTLSGDVALTADTTYYAHWNPATTKVTVKYWKEPADRTADSHVPYELIDSEEINVPTGTVLNLSDSSMTIGNCTLAAETVRRNIANGGAKINGGTFTGDSDMNYFYTDALTAYDADGKYHATDGNGRPDPQDMSVPVSEDGSTIIDVWYNRTQYNISFHIQLGGVGAIHHGTTRKNYNYGPYTIKLGTDVSAIWPDLSDPDYDINVFGLGYSPVSLGLLITPGGSFPDAVSDLFATPLTLATTELLDKANSSHEIELYARYNQNNINGGITQARVTEHFETVSGGSTTKTFNYNYAKGDRNTAPEPYITSTHPGYVLDAQTTISANGGTSYVTDNQDGTASIHYKQNGRYNGNVYNNYRANVYYKLDTYAVYLNYGDTNITSANTIKYTQTIQSYLQGNGSTADIFADPTEAAGVPDYMEFGGWYTDEDCNEDYKLLSTTIMPSSNVILYAKYTPKKITVNIDNGKTTADQTKINPALNGAGSEYGGSVRYLDYTSAGNYVAHEHTVAEFMPTFWTTPVWEDHVFKGWKISYDNGASWEDLRDLNEFVDGDIKLKAEWQDMTRHNIHYIEEGKEVYLDTSAYVEGCNVVVKGTDTEIYDKTTETSKVFRYWLAEDGTTQYKPGDIIEMGDADITLTAVFEEGGSSSGGNKATYTFVVPDGSGWETYYEEIVYKGERLSPPPVNPTKTGSTFQGWYVDEHCKVKFEGFGTVNAPKETTLYASFSSPYRVTYYGQDDELITVQNYAGDGSEKLDTSGVGLNYAYSADYAVIGWTDQKTTPGDIPASYYNGPSDHSVDSDMSMYPVLEGGNNLYFVTAPDAIQIPAKFYSDSQNLNFTWPDPDTVTRPNYTFTGKWYTDAACTTEFNWNRKLTEDTTIYAEWVLNEGVELKSDYTVAWWVEKADSNGDRDDISNYYYSNSVVKNDVAVGTGIGSNTTVNANGSNSAASNKAHVEAIPQADRNYFEYHMAKVSYSSGLEGDDVVSLSGTSTAPVDNSGKTTLNIFVSRVRYTAVFNGNNVGKITYDGTERNSWTVPGGVWLEMPWGDKWPTLEGNGNDAAKLTMNEGNAFDSWAASVGTGAKTRQVVLSRDNLPSTVGGTLTYTLGSTHSAIFEYKAHYRFRDSGSSEYSEYDYNGNSYDQSFDTQVSLSKKDFYGYSYDSMNRTGQGYELKTNYQSSNGRYYYRTNNNSGTNVYVKLVPGTGSNKIDIVHESDGTPYEGNNRIYCGNNNTSIPNASSVRSANSTYFNSTVTINNQTTQIYTDFTFYYTRNTNNILIRDSRNPNTTITTVSVKTGESLNGKVNETDPCSAHGITAPDGMEFDAWSRSATSVVPISFTGTTETMPDNQMVIYAHWRTQTVTVTYVDYTDEDEEIVLNTVTKNINTRFRDFNLNPVEKQGYAFEEWRDADTNEKVDNSTVISSNIKVKAEYRSLKSKPVYYDLNGATVTGSGTPIDNTTLTGGRYKDNDIYVLGATVPAKSLDTDMVEKPEGTVSFVYWSTEADGTGKLYYPDDVIELPENEDTILYAIWAPDMSTTLHYDLNFTGKPGNESVVINDYRDLIEAESKEIKVNDVYLVGTKFNETSEKYEQILYTISGKTYTATGTRPGYTMTGWDEDDDETAAAAYQDGDKIRTTSYKAEDGSYLKDQTLYAHWDQDVFDVEAYEIVKGVENTTPTTAYTGEYTLPDDATVPAVYNCGADDSDRFDTAYLAKINKSFPNGTEYAYAKIGGAKVQKIQYVAITNTHGHITGYKWQYTTNGTSWNDFVSHGTNKTVVKLYYAAETIEVPIRYLNRAADGTLTEISSDTWNVPTDEDDLKTEIGTEATSYGTTAGDTKEFAEEIASKVDNKSHLKLHYVGTGIGSTGSTIALEDGVDPATDYFLQNTAEGVKHADTEDGLDEDDVAVKTGDFAIYVVYEEQPAYIKISNNSTSKNFTFRLTVAGGSYTEAVRTDTGSVSATDGHYDITINNTTSKIVYIPYGAGLAYEVKLFKGSTEVTDLSDESVEWMTGEGYDAATGTLEAGTLLDPSDDVELPADYKHVAIKDVAKHGLTVTNTIEGEYADMTRKFPVTITLTKKNANATIDPTEIPEVTRPEGETEPAFTLSQDGKSVTMTVDLGQNESVEIPAIPADWKYTISEGDHDGYDLTFRTGDATAAWTETAPSGVTIGANNVSVTLKNYFDSEQIVPSGILGHMNMLMLIVLAFALATAEFYILMRRRRVSR